MARTEAPTVSERLWESVRSDEEQAKIFLRETFLAGAMESLFYARKNAGLTQAQLAESLSTTQSVIARTEHDMSGSISLRRYLEWCLACGAMPDLAISPMPSAREVAMVQLLADVQPTAIEAQPSGMDVGVNEIWADASDDLPDSNPRTLTEDGLAA